MKKELSIAITIMLLCQVAVAQTVNPNTSTQFCPNQETEFTVTLSKAYYSLEALNGSIITESPYNVSQDKKSFKFKGKFTDVNKKQTFRINYADGSNPKDFDFQNIQSLFFYDASVECIKIQPNLSVINAPLCQNAAISLSFSAIKWYTAYTNPVNCFGTVTNYEYKLPANWKIGTAVSTGSNWISASNNASIIPDLNTGNNQYVYVRPAACAVGLANNYAPVAIPVTRGSAFTINSSTSSFVCGATPTVALSINSSGVTGITDYSWNFGSVNNGWQFTNGSAVPATYSTGIAPNLSLLPNCGSAISSIAATITNTVNGQTCTSIVAPYTVAITQPNLSINGAPEFCSGSSGYNIVGGLPCNSTVTWGISPTTFVSLGNTNGSTTSLSFITNGATTLSADVTACGVTQPVSKVVQNGVPNYTQNFTPFSIGAFNGSLTLNDNQTVSPNTTITFAVGVDPSSGYTRQGFLNTQWQSSLAGTTITPNSGNGCGGCTNNVGVTMQFPCVTGVTTTYVQARVQNGCGWSNWFTQPGFRLQVDPAGSSCSNGGGGSGSTIYTISPNPASGIVHIVSISGSSLISSVKTYYTSTGALKKSYTFSPASSSVDFSVDLYSPGYYTFQIIGTGGTESQQILVQGP